MRILCLQIININCVTIIPSEKVVFVEMKGTFCNYIYVTTPSTSNFGQDKIISEIFQNQFY